MEAPSNPLLMLIIAIIITFFFSLDTNSYSPAIWGKSIKLGTVIAQVVATIFSYGPHSNMCAGRHIVPYGGGVMAHLFWSGKDSKKGEERPGKR